MLFPEVESSGFSVAGLVRQDNQDAIHLHDMRFAPERGQLFAIADGMGGYSLVALPVSWHWIHS